MKKPFTLMIPKEDAKMLFNGIEHIDDNGTIEVEVDALPDFLKKFYLQLYYIKTYCNNTRYITKEHANELIKKHNKTIEQLSKETGHKIEIVSETRALAEQIKESQFLES